MGSEEIEGVLPVDQAIDVGWDSGPRALPVSIDAQMLRRVVVNLVRNAVQAIRDARLASGQQGPARGTVRVSARGDGDGAAIVVEDDGPGIDEDQRDKVFDPYFTTKADGTGLGLAIVQKVVLEHGGSVEVGASTRLGGARFVVHLPPRRDLAAEAVRAARERALREGVRAST
jgi:signal transduction histidine kinase